MLTLSKIIFLSFSYSIMQQNVGTRQILPIFPETVCYRRPKTVTSCVCPYFRPYFRSGPCPPSFSMQKLREYVEPEISSNSSNSVGKNRGGAIPNWPSTQTGFYQLHEIPLWVQNVSFFTRLDPFFL